MAPLPLAPDRADGGFHSTLPAPGPFPVVDLCMQAWPDAAFDIAHRHGVTAYGVTAFEPHDTFEQAVERLMYWHLVGRGHPNVRVATTVDDIRQAHAEQRSVWLLFSQGGDFVGQKLHRLEAMHRLGLRVLMPAYNRTNQLCGGLLDAGDTGLSRLGRLAVAECNRLGLLVDCTHLARRATLEIVDASGDPVIFSHSNPAALAPNPRNIDDEQIRACVGRGGLVGVVAWGPLVMRPGTTHWPTVDDYLDMVIHVASVAGTAAHVAFSTDMSLGSYPRHAPDPWGDPGYPGVADAYGRHVTPDPRSAKRHLDGFSDYAQIVDLAERMVQRGLSEDDVRGVLAGNALRIFERVWKAPQ